MLTAFSKYAEHFVSVDEIIHRCFTMPKFGCSLKHHVKGLVHGCIFNILQVYLCLLNANVLSQEAWTRSVCGSATISHLHMSMLQLRSYLLILFAWVTPNSPMLATKAWVWSRPPVLLLCQPLYIPYSPQGSTQIKSVYAARSLVPVYIFLPSVQKPSCNWVESIMEWFSCSWRNHSNCPNKS